MQIHKNNSVGNQEIIRLSGLTDLQLSKTTRDNYEELMNSRVPSFDSADDLTVDEIKDVQSYRSNPKDVHKFSNVDNFITELND